MTYREVAKVYAESLCKHCGCPYAPRSAIQNWCYECVPLGDVPSKKRMIRYGLAKPEFDAMYFDQDGACALEFCTREAVAVDHCHTTGRVRGLLCRGCNVYLGFVEQPGWLDNALDYLADA